jgi:hypothetical protein
MDMVDPRLGRALAALVGIFIALLLVGPGFAGPS